MQKIPSIYEELFFPNVSRKQVSLIVQNSLKWRAFVGCKGELAYPSFASGSVGHFYWKRFLFWQVQADYKIISYKAQEHLLADISTPSFRSSILLTLEEKNSGVILRLDHRSFTGSDAKGSLGFFTKYWKKMFHDLEKPLKLNP